MTVSSRHKCPECGGFEWVAITAPEHDGDYICENDDCREVLKGLIDIHRHEATGSSEEVLQWLQAGVRPEHAVDYFMVEVKGVPPKILAELRDRPITEITDNMDSAREQLQQADREDARLL